MDDSKLLSILLKRKLDTTPDEPGSSIRLRQLLPEVIQLIENVSPDSQTETPPDTKTIDEIHNRVIQYFNQELDDQHITKNLVRNIVDLPGAQVWAVIDLPDPTEDFLLGYHMLKPDCFTVAISDEDWEEFLCSNEGIALTKRYFPEYSCQNCGKPSCCLSHILEDFNRRLKIDSVMSSFQHYKQALSDFDTKCMEISEKISKNPGSDCSVGSIMEKLEIELENFAFKITTIPESDLTEDQQNAKDSIPAVRRQIKMMEALEHHRDRQWTFSAEDIGILRIFQGQDEVKFDAKGCYVLPENIRKCLELGVLEQAKK